MGGADSGPPKRALPDGHVPKTSVSGTKLLASVSAGRSVPKRIPKSSALQRSVKRRAADLEGAGNVAHRYVPIGEKTPRMR